MHTIQIDFDIFKKITSLRSTENVTANDVLRKLLGLPSIEGEKRAPWPPGRVWVTKGVTFPNGAEFRANYKGQNYHAIVKDGALVLNGNRFSSPSPAARSITKNSVNGWIFWECKMPGQDRWQLITELRKTHSL